MEVHHSHQHPKKGWSGYLLEFLMLFLAVYLGFLAENLREHQVEHNREKQYMASMLKDLKADTAVLNEGLPAKDGRIKAIDSLFEYFSMHRSENKIPAYVHNLMRRSSWDKSFDRNQTTMSQLRSSGNMRLIRKSNVADSILAYDFDWERANNYYRDTYWSNSGIINDYIKRILADYSLLPYYKDNSSTAARLPEDASFDVQVNPALVIEYMNHLHKVKTTIAQDRNWYRDIEKRAERLIELIQEEYHF